MRLEEEPTTLVYLMNLSFFPIHLVYLICSLISMELSIKLIKTVVPWVHFMITMFPVLYVMFSLEYHIYDTSKDYMSQNMDHRISRLPHV